jgi:hypothetical protein
VSAHIITFQAAKYFCSVDSPRDLPCLSIHADSELKQDLYIYEITELVAPSFEN